VLGQTDVFFLQQAFGDSATHQLADQGNRGGLLGRVDVVVQVSATGTASTGKTRARLRLRESP
jgi:hypothetical protein